MFVSHATDLGHAARTQRLGQLVTPGEQTACTDVAAFPSAVSCPTHSRVTSTAVSGTRLLWRHIGFSQQP